MTRLRTLFASLGLVIGFCHAAGPAGADEYADLRDRIQLCNSCHGTDGASAKPEIPILAGQHFYYTYVQLKDFKQGSRQNEIMASIVEDLKKADLQRLAKYFSEQSWPGISVENDPMAFAQGETASSAGQCVQCHLGNYEGNSRVPRLAGQFPEYLEKTMLDFKNKQRTNSPAKSSLMTSYSEADIAAMAKFLGSR